MADATLLEPPRPHFHGSPPHRYGCTTARPFRPALALGLVHLVQVVLEPGKQTCPALASPAGACRLSCAPLPGVARLRVPEQ
jgi:hypothetical protein